MTGQVRIVIAEDHTILREGLKALLLSAPNLKVVGEAEDGREAIKRAGELRPDLMLLDLSMPRMNGLEAIREIKQQSPDTKILILTVHKTEEYVLASLEAGQTVISSRMPPTRSFSWRFPTSRWGNAISARKFRIR
jgi:DNA-binding NarL/FixJ family response regulator